MFGQFRKKGIIRGSVSIAEMPDMKMFSVSISFFPVDNELANLPFGGEPPADKYKDTISIKENEDMVVSPFSFEAKRKGGYYYLDVGVIAYSNRDGKMYAQVEHFFPQDKPIKVDSQIDTVVELNPVWPDIPFEELGSYGTIYPNEN